VGFSLEWWESDVLEREVYCGVPPSETLASLLVKMDRIPRNVSHRDLASLDFDVEGNVYGATHRIKFDMPGWVLTGLSGMTTEHAYEPDSIVGYLEDWRRPPVG
jgi:hypothetical protein